MRGAFIKNEYNVLLIRHWPPLLCFIVTFCWFGIFACIGVDLHHDGIMLKPATDVANGQVLFRDTFTQYGALTVFLQAFAIKLFGPYLIVIRLTTVLFYSMSVVLLYYIWRNFLSLSVFWILYGLFLILAPFYDLVWRFHPWSSVYALFFLLLANVCMIEFIRRGSAWLLWGAGLSSALAFWCRQPNGIVMYMAILLYFAVYAALERKNWKTSLNNFGIYTAAYVICCLCFLIYLGLNDALVDWYFQSIRLMYSFGVQNPSYEHTPLFKSLFPQSVFIVFPILTLWVLCISLYSILIRKKEYERSPDLMLIVTAIIGLASWHQYYPVPCIRHLYWAAIPMLGFYAYAIQRISNIPIGIIPFKRRVSLSKLLLVVILLFPFCDTTILAVKNSAYSLKSLSTRKVFKDSPMKYMLLSDTEYDFFETLQLVIKNVPAEFTKRPGINFTDTGFFSLYFPNQKNFSPMYVNWGNNVYPNYFSQLSRFLEKEQSLVIADSFRKFNFPKYSLFAVIKSTNPQILFYLPDNRGQKKEGIDQKADKAKKVISD
jgi:hypothetical protein